MKKEKFPQKEACVSKHSLTVVRKASLEKGDSLKKDQTFKQRKIDNIYTFVNKLLAESGEAC